MVSFSLIKQWFNKKKPSGGPIIHTPRLGLLHEGQWAIYNNDIGVIKSWTDRFVEFEIRSGTCASDSGYDLSRKGLIVFAPISEPREAPEDEVSFYIKEH